MKASEADSIVHSYVEETARAALKRYGHDESYFNSARCGVYKALVSMCLVYMTEEQLVNAMPHVFKRVAA